MPEMSIPIEQSMRFNSANRIGEGERIAYGYRDGGRSLSFDVDGKPLNEPDREILVVKDPKDDAALQNAITEARAATRTMITTEDKARFLSQYVQRLLPGDNESQNLEILRRITGEKALAGAEISLGQLITAQTGVCRHKTLLFKVIADEIGIPTALVRGFYRDGRGGPVAGHAWNEVVLENGSRLVVDTMHDFVGGEGNLKTYKYANNDFDFLYRDGFLNQNAEINSTLVGATPAATSTTQKSSISPSANGRAIFGFQTEQGDFYVRRNDGRTMRFKASVSPDFFANSEGTWQPVSHTLFIDNSRNIVEFGDGGKYQSGYVDAEGKFTAFEHKMKGDWGTPAPQIIPEGFTPAIRKSINDGNTVQIIPAELDPRVGLHPVDVMYRLDRNGNPTTSARNGHSIKTVHYNADDLAHDFEVTKRSIDKNLDHRLKNPYGTNEEKATLETRKLALNDVELLLPPEHRSELNNSRQQTPKSITKDTSLDAAQSPAPASTGEANEKTQNASAPVLRVVGNQSTTASVSTQPVSTISQPSDTPQAQNSPTTDKQGNVSEASNPSSASEAKIPVSSFVVGNNGTGAAGLNQSSVSAAKTSPISPGFTNEGSNLSNKPTSGAFTGSTILNERLQQLNGKIGIAAIAIPMVDGAIHGDVGKVAEVGGTAAAFSVGTKALSLAGAAKAVPIVGQAVGAAFSGLDTVNAAANGHTLRATLSGAATTLYGVAGYASAATLADCWNPTALAPAAVAAVAGGAAVTITAAESIYDNWGTVTGDLKAVGSWFAHHGSAEKEEAKVQAADPMSSAAQPLIVLNASPGVTSTVPSLTVNQTSGASPVGLHGLLKDKMDQELKTTLERALPISTNKEKPDFTSSARPHGKPPRSLHELKSGIKAGHNKADIDKRAVEKRLQPVVLASAESASTIREHELTIHRKGGQSKLPQLKL